MPTRSWWNDPSDAWSKKKNEGTRSWALLSASMINLLALLVVSPLSAILLFPANTQFTALTAFNKMHEVHDLIITPAAYEMVTFRTTIAAVLNQSTSAWVSTEYAVVPFWPSTFGETPMGAIFTGLSPQNWSSRATVYQVELECVPMSLLQTGNVTWTENLLSDTTEAFSNITFEATSDDGCSIVFSGVPGINKVLSNSGGWWAPAPYDRLSQGITTNNATLSTCANRSMLLIGSASNMVTGNCHGYCFGEDAPSFDAKIMLCSS